LTLLLLVAVEQELREMVKTLLQLVEELVVLAVVAEAQQQDHLLQMVLVEMD
jgi:hypothetical protein